MLSNRKMEEIESDHANRRSFNRSKGEKSDNKCYGVRADLETLQSTDKDSTIRLHTRTEKFQGSRLDSLNLVEDSIDIRTNSRRNESKSRTESIGNLGNTP